jgi:predicted PurR-regulated permease PerM
MKRSDFSPVKVTSPPRREWRLRHELRSAMRMAATGLGIFICYRLLTPFFPAITAALALAVVLMFWWLGLSAPLLWGIVMAVAALVPVVGAFVVWIPAALYLLLEDSWGKALMLALWGVLVVGTIDNLLRPVLVGKSLQLHTVLVFLSMTGGLILFGPAGFILGPVGLAVSTVLLEIQRDRGLRAP